MTTRTRVMNRTMAARTAGFLALLGLVVGACNTHVTGVDPDADMGPQPPDLSGLGEPVPDLAGWMPDFSSPPRT